MTKNKEEKVPRVNWGNRLSYNQKKTKNRRGSGVLKLKMNGRRC